MCGQLQSSRREKTALPLFLLSHKCDIHDILHTYVRAAQAHERARLTRRPGSQATQVACTTVVSPRCAPDMVGIGMVGWGHRIT